MIIKKHILFLAGIAIALTSCGNKTDNTNAESVDSVVTDINAYMKSLPADVQAQAEVSKKLQPYLQIKDGLIELTIGEDKAVEELGITPEQYQTVVKSLEQTNDSIKAFKARGEELELPQLPKAESKE